MVTVNTVAKMFNVHPDTIRRWEKKGLIQSVRHPLNRYRLFALNNIEKLLEAFK